MVDIGALSLDTFNYLIVSIIIGIVGCVLCEFIPKANEWKYAYKFVLLGWANLTGWYVSLMLFTEEVINFNNGMTAQNVELAMILCTIMLFVTGAFVLNMYDFYNNSKLSKAVDNLGN